MLHCKIDNIGPGIPACRAGMALAYWLSMDIAAARTAPPLHDLLGVSFVFNAAINALAWDGDLACFGLADGAVVMMAAHWPGAPHLAPRPGGGLAIVPSAAPPPPPMITGAHRGPVLALAPDPVGGVVSGGADGKCLRLAGGGDHPARRAGSTADRGGGGGTWRAAGFCRGPAGRPGRT
jgi:hypothetical protein